MAKKAEKNSIWRAVDLSGYPELVVIHLGMRALSLRGALVLLGLVGPIKKSVKAKPDGLLLHEFMLFTAFPLHAGMRQYWRDFESLETWARSDDQHSGWWKKFREDTRGTAFWHETYFMKGGMEAIYSNP